MTAPANVRTRRSALNFGTGVLLSAVSVALAFVATPLILRWLGTERFGALRAAGDWLGHLSILELGLGGALAPLLALAVGRGELPAVRHTMAEGIRAYALVSGATLVAGFLLTLAMTRLVPVGAALAPDLRRACLIGLIGLLMYPLLPFRSLVEGSQRSYVLNLLLLVQNLVITGGAVLLAWRGWGITGQFLALVAGQVVFHALLARDGLARFPGLLRAAVREPRDAQARREIRRLNVPTFVFNLCGRVGLLTDNIILALLLGPAKVVPLFLTQRLLALAQVQLAGVGNASWAALAELHALDRRDVFNARLLELTRLVAALSIATVVPIAAYNHHFVARWVGDGHFGGDLVTAVAAVNAYLVPLLSLWGWCFGGTGQVGVLVPVAVVGAALNLAASVIFTRWLGIAGPLLGTLVALLTTSAWYLPRQLRRSFGTELGALLRAVMMPLAWSAPVAAALVWVARAHEPPGWPALGAEMVGSALLLLAVWWLVVLSPADRAGYRARARVVVPRASGP
ncbi:MAG: polysaccharide biosynthesis C-terminal domain-containing protein [Gemmatimonadetes bacterium]|nr:polysaccharide biosynthesis C-terminal domain-containing protein [Gemmatimonadota bacterium]